MGSKSLLVRHKILFGLIFAFGFLFQGALIVQEVSASTFSSESTCLEQSDGRDQIPSVQWACENDADDSSGSVGNWCTAWIGSIDNDKNNGLIIDISSLDGWVGANLYGMCTNTSSGHTSTVRKVEFQYDNWSVIPQDISGWSRGSWGSPISYPLDLDIPAFISGDNVSSWTDGSYTMYHRNINICRWNGNTADTKGSCQESPVTLRYYNPPPPPVRMGQSCVDNVCTEVINGRSQTRSTDDYWLTPAEAAKKKINFKHYLYSDNQLNGVSWLVKSNWQSPGSFGGNADLTSWDPNGYYRKVRDYTLNNDLTRPNVRFTVGGNYEPFCETLYYDDNGNTTKVCSTVHVPYNFENNVSVGMGDTVYAGDKVSLASTKAITKKKYNNKNRQTYATVSPNTKIKIATYVSDSNNSVSLKEISGSSLNLCNSFSGDNCNTIENKEGIQINTDNRVDGGSFTVSGSSVNVPDVAAGKYFCVAAAVYPYKSDGAGSTSWAAQSTCRQIAKRPSFQVWGGSLYIAGSAKTSTATKNNLANVNGWGYTVSGGNKSRVFGSWVELGIISNGVVEGLASGAALGNTADNIGGDNSAVNDYCKSRVPLSFSNFNNLPDKCPAGQQTAPAGVFNDGSTRKKLVEYVINNVSTSKEEKDGNISVGARTINPGVTHVIRATGNVTITGDIKYDNNNKDKKYTNLSQIPKLIIYAKDIIINCNVTQVDAILIAEGNVNTCPSENYNSSTNAKRLKINGMILANSLTLNRTYGAGTGTNSKEPAEIINYDTSTVLWLNYKITSTENGGGATKNDDTKLSTTYIHELAPRY